MISRPRRLAFALAGALLLAAAGVEAADDDSVALARAAYARGAKAYDAKDYASAAREFRAADELAPNPVALTFALQAALKLDDAVLGMGLVERAAQAGGVAPALVLQARSRFAHRAGRIALQCPNGTSCRVRIDGDPAKPVTWVTPGSHAVEWDSSGRTTVTVAAGQSVDVNPPPGAQPPSATPTPTPTPTPGTENSSAAAGISPTWFWVGIGVTTIGLGASIASGVDTLHRHETFAALPTSAGQQDGRSAQLRTNVLFGVTGAFALATAGIGIFAVGWGHGQKASTTVDLQARGLGIAVTLRR